MPKNWKVTCQQLLLAHHPDLIGNQCQVVGDTTIITMAIIIEVAAAHPVWPSNNSKRMQTNI